MEVRLMSLHPTRKKSITLILDVEDQTVQHLMNVQLIENFQNQDLGVALDLLINLNRTETVIGNEVRRGPGTFIDIYIHIRIFVYIMYKYVYVYFLYYIYLLMLLIDI